MPQGASHVRKPLSVLFVCEDNARRSLIAEALFRDHWAPGLRAYSAGLEPAEMVDPLTQSALTLAGLGSDGLWPKSWTTFADAKRARIDVVVLIGDAPAAVLPSAFPGSPEYLIWRMPAVALPLHRGVWQDIKELRVRVDALIDDLNAMQELSVADAQADAAE